MTLINEVKKQGIDAEEREGQAGGSQKESVNEPAAAANTELERSGSE